MSSKERKAARFIPTSAGGTQIPLLGRKPGQKVSARFGGGKVGNGFVVKPK